MTSLTSLFHKPAEKTEKSDNSEEGFVEQVECLLQKYNPAENVKRKDCNSVYATY